MTASKGLIHKIERASLHDGPGIRTLVIMKGCPLRCLWCSSPYTQATKPEVLYIASQCTGCGRCIDACPENAITRSADGTLLQTDRSLCTGCGTCIAACVNGARQISGRYYSVDELLHEVEKDAAFYRRSGGGVTVGGGEPTMQADFVAEFLKQCRGLLIHTAMETCALTSWEKMALLIEQLDLVYIDLKHMDDTLHRQWTGASNQGILNNIRRAAETNQIILRIPLVPGFNDSPENISASADFAKELGKNLLRIELLPYHQFGMHTYTELERDYEIESIEPPTEEHIENLRDIVRAKGVVAEIGG